MFAQDDTFDPFAAWIELPNLETFTLSNLRHGSTREYVPLLKTVHAPQLQHLHIKLEEPSPRENIHSGVLGTLISSAAFKNLNLSSLIWLSLSSIWISDIGRGTATLWDIKWLYANLVSLKTLALEAGTVRGAAVGCLVNNDCYDSRVFLPSLETLMFWGEQLAGDYSIMWKHIDLLEFVAKSRKDANLPLHRIQLSKFFAAGHEPIMSKLASLKAVVAVELIDRHPSLPV